MEGDGDKYIITLQESNVFIKKTTNLSMIQNIDIKVDAPVYVYVQSFQNFC